MSDRSIFKKKLRYHRIIVVGIVLSYIWIQYEYSSGNWNYNNGQPKIDGQHINGKDEGTWTWFYQNGKKQMQFPNWTLLGCRDRFCFVGGEPMCSHWLV